MALGRTHSLMPSPSISLGLIAVSLGLITLIGPASIDMYLPFIPAMAQELGTDYAAMQLTLAVFLVALGAGQLICGPLIDAYGRRRPLLTALFVFALASLGAAYAYNLPVLLLARAVQGLAASLVLVTAMSTVRDVTEGADAAKLFAMLMTIQGVGPVLAPAAGGLIGSAFGWRGVFIALAMLGCMATINSAIHLKETLPPAARSSLRPGEVLRTYAAIMQDQRFVLAGLTLSAAFVFIFVYVGGAAYVYQTHYGLSPRDFGFVFGGTGIAVFIGAAATAKLVARFRTEQLAIAGLTCLAVGALVGLVSVLTAIGLPGIIAGFFIALAGVGMAEAMLMSMALSLRSTALGASAALLGAVPLLLGAAITPVAAIAAKHNAATWLGLIFAVGVIAVALSVRTARMIVQSGVTVSHAH